MLDELITKIKEIFNYIDDKNLTNIANIFTIFY